MIKYRKLTQEEFKLLEDDFVRFLAANSITATDWQKLKSDSPERVDELLGVFSNTVLEKVYAKTNYLLLVKPTEILAFKMEETSARLLGVRFKSGDLDLLPEKTLESVFNSKKTFLSHHPELFRLVKTYDKPKPEEVFFLVKQGAEVVDNKWFVFLEGLNH